MNAKQAEQITGISRRNLRFYEDQGLITPQRNPENDYRDYSEKDIEDLKIIRMLRMLDTPLEDISSFLHNQMTIEELSKLQENRLKEKQKEVEMSIRFCKKLQSTSELNAEYIDNLLEQMDKPEIKENLFDSWKKDYKKVAKAESQKAFTFTPDDAVTTPAEFTSVLCKYANDNGMDIVIKKESLAPEFELNGIDYTAQRIYRRIGPVPVLVVRCTALHPEVLDADVPGAKGKIMKLFHNWWLVLLFIIFWLPRVISANEGKRFEVLLVGVVLLISISSVYWVFKNYKN